MTPESSALKLAALATPAQPTPHAPEYAPEYAPEFAPQGSALPELREVPEGEHASDAATMAPIEMPAGRAPGLPQLPIHALMPTLRNALCAHAVTIVCGATGSGKSTQLPQLCLELWPEARIGMTQPRRIAARAVAGRIAQEQTVALGTRIGFQTRFDRQCAPDTRLKVMTDGILLQEIARDPRLAAYDVLIIDEVHERSLNIDFLLGYLRTLIPRRPDLRVVLMSATIEAERFAAFFETPAMIDIPGATYPVEVRYRPPEAAEETAGDLYAAIAAAVAELDAEARGDILVFLPGEREIHEAAEVLRGAQFPGTEILPLYARLGFAEQQRVFQPHAQRRLILSTNVAETSVTVPGVRHVIDSGLARLASYNARSKLQRLPVSRISQASADQRKGRCGRERAGICIRLYSEAQLARAPRYTEPELQRSNLAGVILRLADLRLGRMEDFPLLDPPRHNAIADGYQLLRELGAIDGDRRLQGVGRKIARLPLDPRLGRMVLAGKEHGCLREIIVIVSALSAGDPRERPVEARQAADLAHARFRDPRSDFLWFLAAWSAIRDEMLSLSRRQQQAWCATNFLSWRRIREWLDVARELESRLGVKIVPGEDASYRAIHQALLTGLVTRVARWENKSDYIGCRQQRIRLHPSSAVRQKPPRWIMAGEIAETTLTYARLVAKIDPRWVSQVGGALIRRSYSAGAWDDTRGESYVLEEQALHGLVLISGRRVTLQEVDPSAARLLLIREGLVGGMLGARPRFLEANLALVARVQAAEARARRRDLLAEDAQLEAFYAERLPPAVCTRRQLLAWLRDESTADARLTMDETIATREGIAHITPYLYPDHLQVDEQAFPLTYAYAPGEEHDGVTLDLPLAFLAARRAPHLDRLVPGLLAEKIAHLVRRLPKEVRRYLSPVAEYAPALTAAIEGEKGSLAEALGVAVQRITGLTLPLTAWRTDGLPPHLSMRVRLLDGSGRVCGITRNLPDFLTAQREALVESFRTLPWTVPSARANEWVFGALPPTLVYTVGGVEVRGYPALQDDGETVGVQVLAREDIAHAAHHAGVLRLLGHALERELRALARDLAREPRLALQALAAGFEGDLANELGGACLQHDLFMNGLPRDESAFAATLARTRAGFSSHLQLLREGLRNILPEAGRLLGTALPKIATRWPEAANDIRQQVKSLLHPGFLQSGPDPLVHHPRYLKAIAQRLERLEHNPQHDALQLLVLRETEGRCAGQRSRLSPTAQNRLQFLLAELRVALFAPTIRPMEKVSPQRIDAFVATAMSEEA